MAQSAKFTVFAREVSSAVKVNHDDDGLLVMKVIKSSQRSDVSPVAMLYYIYSYIYNRGTKKNS